MAGGPPIDRGWAWMILLGSHVCLMFLIGGYKSLGIVFVEFQELFGASSAKTALLMGLIPGGMSLLSPFATAIGERTSFRRVGIVGGIICGLGIFLTAFAPNMLYVILVFGLLTGVGYGFAFSPSIVVVGQYFHKRRSLANGLAFAGGSIGQLLIPLALRAMTDEFGFRGAMMIYGALAFNIIVGASLFRPIASYIESKPHNIPDNTNTEDICDKCNKIKRPDQRGRLASSGERPINKSLEKVKHESCARVPEVKTISYNRDLNGSERDLEGDQRDLLIDNCQCDEGLYDKYHYTSTGSLCYMQDPPHLPSPAVEEVAKKTDGGTIWQAIAASFCCCFYKKPSHVKPLFRWQLFNEPLYVLWLLGICVGNCGYVNSVVFLPPYLAQIGLSKYTAAIILSGAGVCDLVGRIAGGWFGDLGYVQRHNFMAVCMLVTAGACVVFAMIETLSMAIMYAVFVGILGGSYIALMAVVLVDFIGLAELPNAFGIGVFFMGLFNVPTPALLGLLQDNTGSYRDVYLISAVLMALCAVFFFASNIVYWLRRKKKTES